MITIQTSRDNVVQALEAALAVSEASPVQVKVSGGPGGATADLCQLHAGEVDWFGRPEKIGMTPEVMNLLSRDVSAWMRENAEPLAAAMATYQAARVANMDALSAAVATSEGHIAKMTQDVARDFITALLRAAAFAAHAQSFGLRDSLPDELFTIPPGWAVYPSGPDGVVIAAPFQGALVPSEFTYEFQEVDGELAFLLGAGGQS